MRIKIFTILALLFFGVQPVLVRAEPAAPADAAPAPVLQETETASATPQELIRVTNAVRTGNGLQALTVNSILMSTAQQTANFMAANQMGGHIGGVRSRIMAAGYGSGTEAWATENIMTGGGLSADTIVREIWSDNLHSIPVLNPIYCDIGAGVATDSEGEVYYVVHAAYSEKRYCGPYIAPDGSTLADLATPLPGVTAFPLEEALDMSEYVYAVQTTTPDVYGDLVHVVKPGQSLWSIAIAYSTKIEEIQRLNGLPADWLTVYTGQKLLIAKSVTPNPSATYTPDAAQFTAGSSTPAGITQNTAAIAAAPVTPEATLKPTAAPRKTDGVDQFMQKAILAAAGLGFALIVMGVLMKQPRTHAS